ncbi:CAF17-like 4Fe-4S cluster assembly/insertion protein YgfZ [Pseudomonas matsuisoli]|uniref:tRNA-modifying protein YgfZ n=1 Tax=Pseudomonas matsuisoli TaxID=1515666 RepID=A0A917PKH7_9PSED|nr:folate-binding protein YgfZ [Pseudomonas matsuisoli]GGJ82272.1 tRNA-modifying protein YgfZ [Pseudomonas matsuisoli]
MIQPPFFTHLNHERVLAIRGPDAKKFLQGQLTCNLDYLEDGDASLGARCTPKGRMVSSFRILKDDDGYLLAMAADLFEPQLTDLKKYAVFSKVALSDESESWHRLGVVGTNEMFAAFAPDLDARNGATSRDDNQIRVNLGCNRLEIWSRLPGASAIGAIEGIKEAPLNSWLLAQVRAGEGQVFGETREMFIPQMINLQAVGGVSFKKGCYTGQEIVARMQYLGRLKRRLYRLALESTEVPQPGVALFSPVHNSSVGEVVLAARSETGTELLAVLQEDAATDSRIHLDDSTGPALKLLELPYVLDRDQEIRR